MTLSVYNNNPGNLRPVGANAGFQQFSSPQEGLSALERDLLLKISGRSKAMKARYGEGYAPTLSNLINTWAPPKENDTSAYLRNVSAWTGIAPEQQLTPDDVKKLTPAIIRQEGGKEASQYYAQAGTTMNDSAGEESEVIAELRRRGLDENGQPIGQKDYGLRQDGTPKGAGYFGELKRPDGNISTELSIGVNLDGKETEIPSLVPTLSKEEVDYLLAGNAPSDAIVQKAVNHAKERIASGKSPFADNNDSGGDEKAAILAELKRRGVTPEPDNSPMAVEPSSALESGLKGFGQEAGLGFLDEAVAGLMTPFMNEGGLANYGKTYRQLRDDARGSFAKAESDNPKSYLAGAIPGGIASAIALPVGQANTLGAAVKTGAKYGALSGYGHTDKEDIGGQALDVGLATAAGGAGGAVGYGLGKAVTSQPVQRLLRDETGAGGFPGILKPPVSEDKGFTAAEKAVVKALITEKGLSPDDAAQLVRGAGKPGEGGVALSLPESSQSKSLLAFEKQLRQNPGKAGEVEGAFVGNRASTQLPEAYQSELRKFGQISTPEAAGKRVVNAAGNAVKAAEAKRAAVAKPLYETAYKQVVDDKAAAELLKNPVTKSVFEKVTSDPVWQAELAKHPQGSLGAFDVTKQYMDDLIETAKRAGDKNRSRILTEAKNELTTKLDEISPAYQEARNTFAKGSPRIDKLRESTVGLLADMTDNPAKAAETLFKSSPEQIRFARKIISASDPQGWNNLVATHMAEIGNKVNHSPAKLLTAFTDQGGGNVIKQKALDAALTPAQREVKNRVFADLAKANSIKGGSDTAANLAARDAMKGELLSPAEQATDAALGGKSKTQLAKDAVAWMKNAVLSKRYEELANIFTGNGADDFAERLAKVDPGSIESWQLINERIARVGGSGLGATTANATQEPLKVTVRPEKK